MWGKRITHKEVFFLNQILVTWNAVQAPYNTGTSVADPGCFIPDLDPGSDPKSYVKKGDAKLNILFFCCLMFQE
jgi:hypothetical protein